MSNVIFVQMCYFTVRPMASYRALEFGADGRQLGMLAAAFGLLGLIVGVPAGRVVDRAGAVAVALGGNIVLTGAVVAAVFAPSLTVLLLCGLLIGAGYLATMVGEQSFIAERWWGQTRARVIGSHSAFTSVGQAVGPPLGLAIATGPLGVSHNQQPDSQLGLSAGSVFGTLAGLATVLLLVVAGRRPMASVPATNEATDGGDLRQPLWRIMLASAVVVASVDVFVVFLPAWAQERGISSATVGALLGVRALVTLAIRFGLRRLLSALGMDRLLVWSLVASVAGFTLLPFSGAATAFPVMVLLGVGLGLAQPLTLVIVMERMPQARQGSAIGMRLTCNRAAQVALPLGLGLAASMLGGDSVFFLTGVLTAVPAALWQPRYRRS